jgi:hypothetical protein
MIFGLLHAAVKGGRPFLVAARLREANIFYDAGISATRIPLRSATRDKLVALPPRHTHSAYRLKIVSAVIDWA